MLWYIILGESESIHCASIANAYQGSKLSSILYTNMRETDTIRERERERERERDAGKDERGQEEHAYLHLVNPSQLHVLCKELALGFEVSFSSEFFTLELYLCQRGNPC